MNKYKRLWWIAVSWLALLPLVAVLSCTTPAQADEIQGFLTAMQGKEMVIELEDGTKVHINVEKAADQQQAEDLVGKRVNVKVRGADSARDLMEIRGLGEDQKFSGALISIGADTFVIGGQTFKVDALTRLDGGLREGVAARVEFVTLADGSKLATEIETDEEDEHVDGKIESLGATEVVIGGRTFKINEATRIDDGIAANVEARVEFVTKPDGTNVALKIETDEPDDEHFTGVIEAISPTSFQIGGKTFVVNQATELDSGLANGVTARVEFIKLSDGSLVASEIETDNKKERAEGSIESLDDKKVVVNGQTFVVNENTRLDDDLGKDDKVEVRFIELPDGTKVASSIRVSRSGPGGRNSGRGGADDNPKVDDAGQQLPEDQSLTGTITAIGQDSFTVDGKVFKIDRNTMLDSGLVVGAQVNLEFFTLPDGTLLLKEIETGASGREAENEVEAEHGPENEAGDDKGGGSGGGGSGSSGSGK